MGDIGGPQMFVKGGLIAPGRVWHHETEKTSRYATILQRAHLHHCRSFAAFFLVESADGLVLLIAAVTALILANAPFAEGFLGFWQQSFGFELGRAGMHMPIQLWINDGLMAIFFVVAGLEVKREIVMGELRGVKKAALPIAAAFGGMIIPAAIYLCFQAGAPGFRMACGSCC